MYNILLQEADHKIHNTYIVIITHDNISTSDLYTGNIYVACLHYLYRNGSH
jgi:hypothetical protein